MANEDLPIILEIGSGLTKIGISGEYCPSYVFPSVRGTLKVKNMSGKLIGYDAYDKLGLCEINYPVKRGIADKYDIEDIIDYSFKKMKIDPSEHTVFFTDTIVNTKLSREKIIQYMFETKDVLGYFTCSQPYLSLLSEYGEGTGVVVESGFGITQISAYHNFELLPKSAKSFNFGGYDLRWWLFKMLNIENNYYHTTSEKILYDDIKEKHTFVKEKRDAIVHHNSTYKLFDGNILNINDESYYCPELIFNDSAIDDFLERYYHGTHKEIFKGINDLNFDKSFQTLQKEVYDTIMSQDESIREELFEKIIISGGNTMFNGFQKRLENEIINLVDSNTKVKINAFSERKYGSWIGGSVLSSVSGFNSKFTTRQEYDEVGSNIVNSIFHIDGSSIWK